MKQLAKRLVLPMLACLLPMALGLYFYQELPAQIPSHWGFDGTVNDYTSKVGTVFGLPLFLLAMTIFVTVMFQFDPKKKNQSPAIQLLAMWMCPLLGLFLVPMSLFIALGYDVPIVTVVCIFVGATFMIIGNYLPKTKQNYTMGIRLPWTLHSAENWNRTHRLAGNCWLLGGLMLVVSALTLGKSNLGTVTMVVIVALVAIPGVYSFWLYKKE